MPNKTARYADRYAASGARGARCCGRGNKRSLGLSLLLLLLPVCETVLYIFMKNRCQFIKCGLDAS